MRPNQNQSQQMPARAAGNATTVRDLLERNKGAISAAMPKGANFERFVRTVVNAISTTPAIAECSSQSIFLSCVKAFSVGIEPNGPTAEGYLVPFKGTATFMPSYRGLISLARRSGMVSLIYADVIREGDEFEVSRGTDPKLTHKPEISGKSKPIAYYAVARMTDGLTDFEVMGTSEIERIRGKSRASSSGPWVTDYEEMAKKTVLKRLLKRMPMSVENLAFAKGVAFDNQADAGDDTAILDIEGLELGGGAPLFKDEPAATTPTEPANDKSFI